MPEGLLSSHLVNGLAPGTIVRLATPEGAPLLESERRLRLIELGKSLDDVRKSQDRMAGSDFNKNIRAQIESINDLNDVNRDNLDLVGRLERDQKRYAASLPTKDIDLLSGKMRKLRKDTDDADGSTRNFFKRWKTLPRGLRMFILIGSAIAGGAEQIGTLGSGIGATITALAGSLSVALGGTIVMLGGLVAGFNRVARARAGSVRKGGV